MYTALRKILDHNMRTSWVTGGSKLNAARCFLTAYELTCPQVMLKQALLSK